MIRFKNLEEGDEAPNGFSYAYRKNIRGYRSLRIYFKLFKIILTISIFELSSISFCLSKTSYRF